MVRHFLDLADAATVPTEAYLLTRRTVTDLYEAGAMGAVHGEAGTGQDVRGRRSTGHLTDDRNLLALFP